VLGRSGAWSQSGRDGSPSGTPDQSWCPAGWAGKSSPNGLIFPRLELTWSRRIFYSRCALVAAETVRVIQPESHQAFLAAVFHAYFALAKDIEDSVVVAESAEEAGIDPSVFAANMTCAVAENELRSSERRAREHHVTGTPAGW